VNGKFAKRSYFLFEKVLSHDTIGLRSGVLACLPGLLAIWLGKCERTPIASTYPGRLEKTLWESQIGGNYI
jgi:hypothetical protein